MNIWELIEKFKMHYKMVQTIKCLQTMNFLPRKPPKNNFNQEDCEQTSRKYVNVEAFEVRPPES